jgi:A/G-specific adenine glycosylase
VTPLLLDIAAREPRVADDPDARWRMPAELASIGLPAPIRKLLQSLEEPQ